MSATTVTQNNRVSKEKMLGTAMRWRRFGEPVPAGQSLKEDGTPDYGLFGPGSMVWEVLLHPASIVFEISAQALIQTNAYKPIIAGLRDRDPLSIKARAGTVTLYDLYDRGARNSGMHAPMWLGDTETAERMGKHLHNIHKKVTGDVIDIGKPELGGYSASGGRDAMWAALTEMHPLLWAYEAFAFHDGRLPHRLSPAERDQYIKEVGAYARLVGAPEEDIPTTMAEMNALYEKYADLFAPSTTTKIMPDVGKDYLKEVVRVSMANFHISQLRLIPPLLLINVLPSFPMTGAVSGKARQSMGIGRVKGALSVFASKAFLPIAYLMQRPPFERYVTRLMWGPDATKLIASARALHKEALAARADTA